MDRNIFFLFFGQPVRFSFPDQDPWQQKLSLNHWTSREFLEVTTLEIKNCGYFGGRPGAMNGMRHVEGNWGFLAKLFFLTQVKFWKMPGFIIIH